MTLALLLLGAFLGALVGWAVVAAPRRSPPTAPAAPVDEGATWDHSIRSRAAIHEAGHVLAAWACPFASSIDDVRIHESGGCVRYAWPVDERHDNVLWARAVIALAGIASELTVYDTFRAIEARRDLRDAHEIAEALVRSGATAPPDWVTAEAPPFGQMFREIDAEHAAVLRSAYAKARAIVRARLEDRDRIAAMLLARDRLTEADLADVLGHRGRTVLVGRMTTRFPFVAGG